VSVLTHRDDDSWGVETFDDCPQGCTAVSWAPASPDAPAPARRLAVAGCDGRVRLHAKPAPGAAAGAWGPVGGAPLAVAADATKWARDVAWCPAGLARADAAEPDAMPDALLLAAAAGNVVAFFRERAGAPAGGDALALELAASLPPFEHDVWKLSWSATGRLLAVTTADNEATVWKEDVTGATWMLVMREKIGA